MGGQKGQKIAHGIAPGLFRGRAEGLLGDGDVVLGPIVPDSFHGILHSQIVIPFSRSALPMSVGIRQRKGFGARVVFVRRTYNPWGYLSIITRRRTAPSSRSLKRSSMILLRASRPVRLYDPSSHDLSLARHGFLHRKTDDQGGLRSQGGSKGGGCADRMWAVSFGQGRHMRTKTWPDVQSGENLQASHGTVVCMEHLLS